jgi:hypothetical protein
MGLEPWNDRKLSAEDVMSALARRIDRGEGKAPRAMVFIPGKGAGFAEVEVYRDGEAVVVVGSGGGVKQTPHGNVEGRTSFALRFPSVQAYDWARHRAFERDPVKYSKVVGLLGVDDDARQAPEVTPEVLEFVRGLAGGAPLALHESAEVRAVRALPQRAEVVVSGVGPLVVNEDWGRR